MQSSTTGRPSTTVPLMVDTDSVPVWDGDVDHGDDSLQPSASTHLGLLQPGWGSRGLQRSHPSGVKTESPPPPAQSSCPGSSASSSGVARQAQPRCGGRTSTGCKLFQNRLTMFLGRLHESWGHGSCTGMGFSSGTRILWPGIRHVTWSMQPTLWHSGNNAPSGLLCLQLCGFPGAWVQSMPSSLQL